MAGEITTSGKLTYKNGEISETLGGTSLQDMDGDHYIQKVIDVGSSEEEVSKEDIATIGYCFFKNVGASGIISIGGVTAKYDYILGAGESAGPIRWATNALFVKGDAAGCRLEMLILEK